MRIVFAPDSFKGTISASRACELLKASAERVFPGCETVSVPMSDGGEGAAEVVAEAMGGRMRPARARGPLGDPVDARYGLFREGGGSECAVIEMAAASGITLVPRGRLDARRASTLGTGDLILDALGLGVRKLYVAIGGSATNDGGIGCAHALGARFLDSAGAVLPPVPESLPAIAGIDASGIDPRVREAEFTVMCDVANPLLGPEGATHVFGPQKGASPGDVAFLEAGMANYARALERAFGRDYAGAPGAGAAGGLGACLMAFCGARLMRGVEAILGILGFERLAAGADLVVTGEGRIDWQSAYGKVPCGVGQAARRQGVPCVALAGGMGKGAQDVYACGVDAIATTVNAPMPLEQALADAEALFLDAADRMFRLIRVGMKVSLGKSGD